MKRKTLLDLMREAERLRDEEKANHSLAEEIRQRAEEVFQTNQEYPKLRHARTLANDIDSKSHFSDNFNILTKGTFSDKDRYPVSSSYVVGIGDCMAGTNLIYRMYGLGIELRLDDKIKLPKFNYRARERIGAVEASVRASALAVKLREQLPDAQQVYVFIADDRVSQGITQYNALRISDSLVIPMVPVDRIHEELCKKQKALAWYLGTIL